ncbi:ferrous iron transport protein B [uncultured Prevotella sp.]|uniref:ferrous iron transport protein B n=1 Tax=uncultured Prevotella sp. TaxID=159272 RepID=UPI002609C477|nr:ferrous iron transport protein B [uncultured Prevotella sp.]
MRLSELKTGEKGVVVKVMGHGGFRKRIVEMGFIRGKIVKVLLNAPLQDPVKYQIMGYEISLRHTEAAMIEIIPADNAQKLEEEEANKLGLTNISQTTDDETQLTEEILHKVALEKSHTINVALIGNPNCGKTSLFNFVSGAHERVGNYSGVTVDAKEGHAEYNGYRFNIVDLPGTYSLSAYSPEELYVRKQIIDKTPDVIINVIDASNIERNLYLTTQLVDMNLKIVGALNMFDEFESRGDKLDYDKLGELFGFPFVPTVFKTGRGIDKLFKTIINVYEGITEPGKNNLRHIHLNHGKYIEQAIDNIKKEIQKNEQIRYKYSTRFLAIKLLEKDSKIENQIKSLPNGENIITIRNKAAEQILKETREDSETAIMNAKYGIIHGAMQEAGSEEGKQTDTYQVTHAIDAVITNRYVGFPLFFIFLYLMFEITFTLGQYPMDWIENGVSAVSEFMRFVMPEGPLKAMIIDGAIAGVGAVIVFLPQILILYFIISFMEDSGYMARAAFIMDKVMHKMGLHGKSFIPLIMGFGCNVPAIMATRTIESRRSRLITILVLPLMSCSARLPIYIMIIGTFFSVKYQSLIMISLYVIGIALAVIMSRIFSKWLIKGDDTPFVMELPPYRFPTIKAIFRHTWEKGKQYLKKMGGIILVASIIVWALGYFPHNKQLSNQEQKEQSYIGVIGKTIEPIFRVQGFDWKLDVSLIAGVGAKEIIASTMGVLYANDDNVSNDSEKYQILNKQMQADGITPLIAFSYLLFVLIYFPCIATIAAIKSETGSWKWTIFAMLYTTSLAWIISACCFQIGSLLI